MNRKPLFYLSSSRILSLYTKPLPLDVACRVWDIFFRDGEEFLFRTAVGILKLYQDILLDMDLISIGEQSHDLFNLCGTPVMVHGSCTGT